MKTPRCADLFIPGFRLALRGWTLCTAVALSACAATPLPPQRAIEGIESAATEADVDVIMIHGMGFNDVTWAAGVNATLADTLGRSFDPTEYARQPGTLLNGGKAVLYETTLLRDGQHPIRTFAIVWSPGVTPWKMTLCYDASEEIDHICPAPGERRVWINSALKSQILDARLSDVMYYAAQQEDVQTGVIEGLKLSLAGATSRLADDSAYRAMARRDTRIFLMSESLGSKIMFDSIEQLDASLQSSDKAEEHAAFVRAMGHVRTLFMAANQIAILSPRPVAALRATAKAQVENTRRGTRADIALLRAARISAEGRPSREPLKVVAFNDPNDILTWRLEPYFRDLCAGDSSYCADLEINDVAATQHAQAWFGLFEDPVKAHTKYWDDPQVRQILRRGRAAATGQ